GYRQWPPGPPWERHKAAGWATIAMCFHANLIASVCLCKERVPEPLRPVHRLPGSGSIALSAGRRRCRLRVRNQAKRLHGPRIAQGASTTSRTRLLATVASGLRRSGPPEWTWSDRGERSPPERATGVDLERLLRTIR